MSGLISSYFGILRRQNTYFQINNTMRNTPGGKTPTAAVGQTPQPLHNEGRIPTLPRCESAWKGLATWT